MIVKMLPCFAGIMSEASTFLNAIRIVPSETWGKRPPKPARTLSDDDDAVRRLLIFGVSGVVPCFEMEAKDPSNLDGVVAPERRRYIQNEFKLRSGYRN
jgi:hypothetical protein